MTLNFLIILSLTQGITEFLPISSSGHLILLPYFSEKNYEGRTFDVSLHFGCLIAVFFYLRHDLKSYLEVLIKNPKNISNIKFLKVFIVGSIPVMFFGLIIKSIDINFGESIALIGWTTLIFGIILGLSDIKEVKKNEISIKDALIIGLCQSIALIPGVSRSGIIISAGRFLGYSRYLSSKFSLILSIPVLIAAMILEIFDLYINDNLFFKNVYLLGICFSFIFSFITIFYFMKYIDRLPLKYFAIYRVLLGIIILSIFYL